MARLLSVNVGLPQGRRVAGPHRAHRRLEAAGRRAADGAPAQHRRRRPGRPRRARRRAAGGARLPDRVLPLTGSEHLGRDDFDYGQFGENFTVDGPRRRRGVHRRSVPDRRRRVRGHPAARDLLPGRHAAGRAADAGPAGRPPPARLLPARDRRRARYRPATRSSGPRVGPHALSVADIDALLYLPDRDIERARARPLDIPALSPGWQQSFRELLDADGRGTAGRRATGRRRAGWPGFRPLRVAELVPESPTRRPRSTWPPTTAAAAPGAARPVPDRARGRGAASRRRYAATRCRPSPGARRTGSASSASRTAWSAPTCTRSCGPGDRSRRRRPTGRVRAHRRRRPGAARLGRRRRHARPGHAAPARGGAQHRGTCGGSTPPGTRPSTPSPPRRTGCCSHCRARTSASSTPRPTPSRRRGDRSSGGGRRAPRWPASTFRRAPARTSADRPRS